jgi:polyisoprenoid-binding protein YceI
MKKLITWRGDILKKFKFLLIFLYFVILPTLSSASERWIIDTSLSTVEFELKVLFAKNVKGKFNSIEGFVELDVTEKHNNKAIFSVQINDVDMNYIKYKNLLLSNIFFDAENFPKAVVDTKKFSYVNDTEIELEIELTIKGKNAMVPLKVYVSRLAEELIQIQTEMVFSRTAFNIGIDKWQNTSILKDKVKLQTNLFLFKE